MKNSDLFKLIGASVLGATLTLAGNAIIQSQQFNQASIQKDKEQRKEIYLKFLDDTSAISNSAQGAKTCFKNLTENYSKDVTAADKLCLEEVRQLYKDRNTLNGSFRSIYIYGSSSAVTKAEYIMAKLPQSVGTSTESFIDATQIGNILKFDQKNLDLEYMRFVTIACQELPASPRNDCALLK